ncbi:MAG: Aspartate-semialdehyde dehydrogenase 2 [Alphaproteobacteria bacterium MarineAlpha5_Bin5]|nr:MAG: Aspartate-semialdehyde dehydrogenase 2 [Alphaproteobacteria bacterium MarineAlpha5_Bin5]PPR52509.1 MAG: Aspartate-semialdehyde dehydrogenase 2 [Alphaproteobacteria bacterium MarineAlpha5_Bin4]|tara:strand:- start:954 stop:1994 length:1041 start_codon:yes stop_codon:yes gene_type:complete
MSQKYNIAVAGATGAVGNEIIQILDQRDFPIDNLYLLASSRSKGKKIEFKDQEIIVEDLAEFDFSKTHIGLFSPGGEVSAEFAPKAAKAGCIVIDNTSHFRMNKDVPLIVPEVNAKDLEEFFLDKNKSNIISNPNCSTIQMVVALKPLHEKSIINRIVVSTYQAVSGAGKTGMDELFNQTQNIYGNQEIKKDKFTKQIAFNAIPHIGSFLENGNTEEEQKMIDETKKILDEGIKVSATCVRTAVFIGHSESINIEFDSPLDEKKAHEILLKSAGISVIDHRKDEGYVTPVEIAGEDKVYVSRIRNDNSVDNGLNIWVVSDNLRKGAALNAVQIAELLINKYSNYII